MASPALVTSRSAERRGRPFYVGTWNATPFGNDTALDWASDLVSSTDGRALLQKVLARAFAPEGADADEASEAVAAAAVIGAAATEPVGTVSKEIKAWITTTGFAPDADLVDQALRALEAMQKQSELRDLWDEEGQLKVWSKQLDKLRDRIQKARDAGLPIRTAKAAGPPRSLHKMLALYATQPDPGLRKKISAKVAAIKHPNRPSADTDGQKPLVLTARHGLLEETLQLLSRGADPSIDSSRPLAEACAAGHVDVARALVAAGATIFHEFRRNEYTLLVQVPIKNLDEPVQGHRCCLALFAVARGGSPKGADYLRELGASLEQTDLNGETLLHKAAEGDCVPMIHYLVDAGLDASKHKGESGETPLHYAARAGRIAAVGALLERGADVNAIDRFEGEQHRWAETPLDVAESREIRKLLVAHGGRAGDPKV